MKKLENGMPVAVSNNMPAAANRIINKPHFLGRGSEIAKGCGTSPRFSALILILNAVIIASSLLFFVSCSEDDDSADIFTIADFGGAKALDGLWNGEYDGEVYAINIANGTFDSTNAYAGDNMQIVFDSKNDGRFIIKYTRALKVNAQEAPWYSTSAQDAPDVGKWYAVHFRLISYNIIAISGGWLSGGLNAFDSADACRAIMTTENGYFTRASECHRL